MSLLDTIFGVGAKKAQTHQVLYRAEITAQKDCEAFLILPIPPSTPTQQLDGPPVFSIAPASIAVEPTYENEYAIWKLTLKAGEKKVIEEKIKVSTKPISYSNVLKNIGIKAEYSSVETKKYLSDNRFISANDPRVKKIATEIMMTKKTAADIIRACNDHVVKRMTYGNPIPGLYSTEDALTKPKTDCGGYDTLLISLLNACEIPGRIVIGFWLDGKKNDMHAWVEIMLPDGSWLPADPSVEQLRGLGRSKKIGALGEIGSDRLITSVGCDLELAVESQKIRADILQCPIIFPENSPVTIQHSMSATRI